MSERIKTVLVTGISGYLAPHVASAFRGLKWQVVATDKTPSNQCPESNLIDLAESDALLRSGLLDGVDLVCHLGGVGDINKATEDPAGAFRDNVAATYEVVRAAAKVGTPRVVVASTWHLYGRAAFQPVDETHPCSPHGAYSLSKFSAEQLAVQAGAELGVDVVALRLGTAYGPGMRPLAVVRAMVEAASAGRPLTVTDSHDTFRQLTHVTDLASAFVVAADEAVPPGVYNTVADDVVRIRDLAEAIALRFGVGLQTTHLREETDSFEVSSAKFQQYGWRTQVPFTAGLEEAIGLYGSTQST